MKLALALLLAFASFLVAQSGVPAPPAEKWEYCVVAGGDATPAGPQLRLTANIRYATPKGFRDEIVELRVDNPTGQDRDFSWRVPEATANALAQLGAQGWELVTALTRPGFEQHLYHHIFYLKRRLR